jgi:voltage-gated potassium channel
LPLFDAIMRRAYVAIATLTWSVLFAVAGVHAFVSYILLVLAGESGLTGGLVSFIYFYVVTATTVGYGDMSPATSVGRIASLLVVIPGSIAIFTAVLGKAITDVGTIWSRRMNGYGDFSEREGHTIILGWQGARTRRLIELLVADHEDGEKIILVDKSLEQNPMPAVLDYVRSDALSTPGGLQRAGIGKAARVIIRGADDDETIAATLAASSSQSSAHIVAHFEDDRAVDLISRQCPDVEAIGSLSAELLVRASRDPGASRVADRLLSAESEDTAFSMIVPTDTPPIMYLDAMVGLKRHYGLTLVGLSGPNDRNVDLNCPTDRRISGGDQLFYIADIRLPPSDVRWGALTEDKLPVIDDAEDDQSTNRGKGGATST